MRGAVFELVSTEVAGGGVGGRGVRAVGAAVLGCGEGFAGPGLVYFMWSVSAWGSGGYFGLRVGEGFGGVVVSG